ncbi:hypothetical protein [Treponema sp. OMZ 799]|uniref:hypothetical protein n=1 Tax=Treponema sp. OMZ 799 TaxID=2563668 RepID=UPI0020A269E3|nr:hypothetical protein [Treponema sp. OMZ 799]
MNGNPPETTFTKQLEKRVNETKEDEEKRREYMLLKSFEMDARRAGLFEGIQQGIQQGISQGSYQTRLETAKMMKLKNFDIALIKEISGLSAEEIEKL